MHDRPNFPSLADYWRDYEDYEAELKRGTITRTGFTGTRKGMSHPQFATLYSIMSDLKGYWHHGDCVNGDEQSHAIAFSLGLKIEIHPALNANYRANCQGATLVHPPRGYLDRNHDIVDVTSQLIAAPEETKEALRSGTWATVRYARSIGRPITLIFPDGSIRKEHAK